MLELIEVKAEVTRLVNSKQKSGNFGLITNDKFGKIKFYPEIFLKEKNHPKFDSLKIGDILIGKIKLCGKRYKMTVLTGFQLAEKENK